MKKTKKAPRKPQNAQRAANAWLQHAEWRKAKEALERDRDDARHQLNKALVDRDELLAERNEAIEVLRADRDRLRIELEGAQLAAREAQAALEERAERATRAREGDG